MEEKTYKTVFENFKQAAKEVFKQKMAITKNMK